MIKVSKITKKNVRVYSNFDKLSGVKDSSSHRKSVK